MDRLFNLDLQLVFDAAVTGIAVFVLFVFLSYMFSDPIRKLLKDRQEKIKNDIDSAVKNKDDALQLKTEYEMKLKEVQKEAEVILMEARKKATQNEHQIIAEAKEEALRIKERALNEIELEKKKVADDMKREMIQMASLMAGKIVKASVDENMQDALILETLEEMGDSVWQN